MKKMFLVLNKEKIYAYVVSIMTIVTLFFLSSLMNSDLKETKVTSSNGIEENFIGEAISTSTPNDANTDVKKENKVNDEDKKMYNNSIEIDEKTE